MYLKKLIRNIFRKIIIYKNYYFENSNIPYNLKSIYIENSSKCNLNCKFCGYYKRDLKKHPMEIMQNNSFIDYINQAIGFGYENVGLTPATGDIFMDKEIFEKLDYLENLKSLKGYHFTTNFIPIKDGNIKKILQYKKLNHFGISIYGSDKETFMQFTQSTKSSYNKLIKNLNDLNKEIIFNNSIEITIWQRSEKNFKLEKSESELSNVIKKLIKNPNISYAYNEEYNNWGGMIKKIDVADLNIDLVEGKTFKKGPCSLIFSRNIIGADGKVNACACRDANFELTIGNLKEQRLSEILSKKNEKYMKIINDQNKGNFHSVCKNCDFYVSIYDKRHGSGYSKEKSKKITLEEFYKNIN